MKVVTEETAEVVVEETEDKDTLPLRATKTLEVPKWVQFVEKLTQGIGLVIGVILALPFIAISRGIEWYQNNKKTKENK